MTKILVIDDEPTIRCLFEEELSLEGYNVISTGDCHHVLQIINDESPDVVILDIKMGQCDGRDVLTNIRKANDLIPVILCSAYAAFKDDIRSSIADYYVVKSANLDELKTKIRRVLKSSATKGSSDLTI